MKKIIFVILLFSCSDNNEQVGCVTAIRKGETDRTFIRCATYKQWVNGDGVNASAEASSSYYQDQKWEPCSNCQ